MSKIKYSIVVPCFNEAENLPIFLSACRDSVKRDDVEIILVNNGSTDATDEVLKKELPLSPFLKIVKVDVNQGYGFGILSGLNKARGEYMGWTHGDTQTPTSYVMNAIEIIENEDNPEDVYVKGNRKKRTFFDSFFTFGMSIFESFYLRQMIYDINAQPNLFHKDFYASWTDAPHDFSLDLYALFLAKKQGLKVIRFPVLFPKRVHGESNWNKDWKGKWKFIKRTLVFSIDLKKSLKEKTQS